MSQVPNAFAEFVSRYGPPAGAEGPVRFVVEVFGATIDPWQEDTLRAYGRGERGISIRACHGPGKTALAAWLVWHQLLCKFPQKTVATAPSSAQLKGALVPEVKMWGRMLPGALQELFDVKAEGIYLKAAPESSYFEARTARAESPEALQGVHSEHVLLIADEASGVPEQIYEAAKGSMSGHNATTLLLSNPTRTSGTFYDTHTKIQHRWFTVHVSYKDSSRVTAEFARELAEQYGEDSNVYRVRALGEFPTSDQDTVIPLEYVESARSRDIVMRPGLKEVWGLDVARFGDDTTALVRRNSIGVIQEIEEWQKQDTMETAGKIKAKWDALPPSDRPEVIMVDVIGLGAGVVDRLWELKLPVRGVNVSESASAGEKYAKLRSELWFKAKDWLETKDHTLPLACRPGEPVCSSCKRGGQSRDCLADKLAAELTMPRFKFSSNGKLMVEPKDEMKKRGLKSPNVADAFVLTFAAESSALIYGSQAGGYHFAWHEPITRNRTVV